MEFPRPRRELSKEEVQDAQIGLLEWELEERDVQHGIDHLTGLKTRKAFERELEKSLKAIREREEEHRRSSGEPLREVSLLFIDLDNFKQVNDQLDHAAGDEVLKKVAQIFTDSVRESDVVGRFGGDEFLILLPRVNETDAAAIGNKIRENMKHDARLSELNITASLGVCSSRHSSDPVPLMHFADQAAKKAKQSGKDAVEIYSGA